MRKGGIQVLILKDVLSEYRTNKAIKSFNYEELREMVLRKMTIQNHDIETLVELFNKQQTVSQTPEIVKKNEDIKQVLKEALNYYEMMKFQIKELELQHICKISLIKDKGLYGNFLKLLL